ncbi:MAG: D-alanyl-D-alanine carboxypeptidase family protein [bacterium]
MAASLSRSRPVRTAALCLTLAALLAAAPAAAGRRGRAPTSRASLLVEAETGRVLRARNPRQRLIPASIVKMMLTLITLEHIRGGSVRLSDIVTVSRRSARVGGHQVYLAQGERFRLEDLMKAVVIGSANDASHAVAEHVAGDSKTFVRLMNERARRLGMTDTRFVNVHGLPPGRGRTPNRMSARDAAILAREILKYPSMTRWSRTRIAPFRGGKFTLTNTNRLIGRFPGADGLKTGSYRAAGYSVVATAKRRGLRLIAVILSSKSHKSRFAEARRLLDWGFARYRWFDASQAREFPRPHTVRIMKGRKKEVALRKKGSFRMLIRRGAAGKVTAMAKIPAVVHAPVKKGQPLGRIIYRLGGKKLGEIPLIAAESVERLGFFNTFIHVK